MAQNNVLQFAPRRKQIDQQSVSVLAALAARLDYAPPERPGGLEACVAHLSGGAQQLAQLPFGQRRLLTLRDSLFTACGREPEMRRLWRETVAAACNAAVLARVLGLDESCITAAALLHRIGEVWLTAALADAEALTGARLRGAPLRELLNEQGRHLLPRLVRAWALAPAVKMRRRSRRPGVRPVRSIWPICWPPNNSMPATPRLVWSRLPPKNWAYLSQHSLQCGPSSAMFGLNAPAPMTSLSVRGVSS